MALRITCPGCKTALKLDDEMRGRKVRCTNCDKLLNIPGVNGKKSNDEDAVQEGRKLKAAAAKAREEEDEDENEEEEERPAKKKKKKKKQKGLPMGMLIGVGGGIALLLIVVVSASAYFITHLPKVPEPVARNEKKADPIPEPPQEERPGKQERLEDRDRKKGGKSIIGNVRGAGYRTERKNELKQIGLFFGQFCDSAPKSARTKEAFLDFIKRDAKVIHETILDGYYVVNLKADHTSSASVVAYERDAELNGNHLVVRGDTSVDYITGQELKMALGK
jgi:predicted Zn finger-like uncharacterized protein